MNNIENAFNNFLKTAAGKKWLFYISTVYTSYGEFKKALHNGSSPVQAEVFRKKVRLAEANELKYRALLYKAVGNSTELQKLITETTDKLCKN